MSFATILERTLAAEAAGFDSVWLMDHLAAPAAPEHDTFEGWTLAAALAVRTTTIRIGHLVTCDPFRHPAVLAKMAATVDVLSDGRLELGLGWGSVERELETYGIGAGPPTARAARMRETIEILDLMFAGEPFDHDGDASTLRGAIGRPRPVQLPRPPLHIGGAGPKLTMPIVRDHADWWNCPTYAVDRLDELRPLAGDARVSVQHPVGLASGPTDRDETVAVGRAPVRQLGRPRRRDRHRGRRRARRRSRAGRRGLRDPAHRLRRARDHRPASWPRSPPPSRRVNATAAKNRRRPPVDRGPAIGRRRSSGGGEAEVGAAGRRGRPSGS